MLTKLILPDPSDSGVAQFPDAFLTASYLALNASRLRITTRPCCSFDSTNHRPPLGIRKRDPRVPLKRATYGRASFLRVQGKPSNGLEIYTGD